MKTAIQELVDEIKQEVLNDPDGRSLISCFKVIKMAEDKLEKEKEQLQKAFSDGQETPLNHPTLPHYSREEYYNDNYNN